MNRPPKALKDPLPKNPPAPSLHRPRRRDPLKPINSAAFAGGATSTDTPRRRCLSVPREAISRNPRSAPPSKPRTNRKPSSFDIIKKVDPKKKPRSLDNNRRQPSSLGDNLSRRKPSFDTAPKGKNPTNNGVLLPGSKLVSTPEKTHLAEAEKKLSNTPNSPGTPPAVVSVSPEIPNRGFVPVAETPVCYAAGHLLAGVPDGRRCRPRGLLAIGGSVAVGTGAEVPPLVEASMQWLPSPPANASAGSGGSSGSRSSHRRKRWTDEASVSWFLLPNADPDWEFSSPDLETPSTGCRLRRTPTSGSSTSPFSAMVQRAEASGLKGPEPTMQRVGYRYGSIVVESPVSEESPFALDSVGEALETIRLPRASDSSFRFARNPETRISWREGLVSRMSGTGELDEFPWIMDDEAEEKHEFRFDFESSNADNWRSMLKEGDEQLMNGFGSVELICDDGGARKREGKAPPMPNCCAESITIDGGEGLGCSGDSDWGLFYRNHLFEA